MSEFRVPVVRVGKIGKHPRADTLSITEVCGVPCIVKTTDFQVGDLAVYVPVEAVVSLDQLAFRFLKADAKPGAKYRVRAVRLREIYSEGLLIPYVTLFPLNGPQPNEGEDVACLLGIEKFIEVIPPHLQGEQERDPGLSPMYDMESWYKYKNRFEPGEEVFISEKIHGCLEKKTKISMADGSKIPITKIKAGDWVLGVDSGGIVVPSKVLEKFDNGKTGQWFYIRGTRRGAGRGNSFFLVKCTAEHRFWNPASQQYVQAKSLKIGDAVSVMRNDVGLSPIQEQISSIQETVEKETSRFDLETETHNYFANEVLVHNCNARFLVSPKDGKFYVGTHRTYQKLTEHPSVYWEVALRYKLEEKLTVWPGIVVYGEIYGQVQDLKYDLKTTELAVFDVYDTKSGLYFAFDAFLDFCLNLHLPMVPMIYVGPYSEKIVEQSISGQSLIANHFREGIVIKPTTERIDRRYGRTILKAVSQEYKLRKKGSELQ